MRLGNGRWETAKFNDRLQVDELGLGVLATDANLWKLQYGYGELDANGDIANGTNNGNIGKITLSFAGLANPLVQRFKYDSLYRLTEATERSGTAITSTPTWTQNFGYDRFGNRMSLSQNIGGITKNTTPSIDPSTNRFNTGQGFSYDANGNIINDVSDINQARSFVFNAENKQIEVRDANGNPIGKYFYDGENRRVKKITDTETTIFVYSAGKLVAEYSTKTPPQNPTTSYTTTDHLGSPRVITNQRGDVISRRDFLPFGEELTINVGARSSSLKYGADDDIRQKFTGYQKDEETNLDFAEARMYENRHARFTAVDPLMASGRSSNPQTFNRFIYVVNNPLSYTDKTGMVIDDWYIKEPGLLEVYRTKDAFDRFYVWDQNLQQYVEKGKLTKNDYGLVEFPGDGYGFTNYNPGEQGGKDSYTGETVGIGDHWLKPVVAASLFGLTNQLRNDLKVTIALNDMSSSNGSDPWDQRYRTYDKSGKMTGDGHHAGHGHDGNRTGLDIDWRYVDKNGNSRKGQFDKRSTIFDVNLNISIYRIAEPWGFTKNFTGTSTPITGVTRAKGHNDHGHFGFDESRVTVREITVDRRKPVLKPNFTIGCIVKGCSWDN